MPLAVGLIVMGWTNTASGFSLYKIVEYHWADGAARAKAAGVRIAALGTTRSPDLGVAK